MKTRKFHLNLEFIVRNLLIVFISSLLFFSCAGMKVLTASYDVIDSHKVTSIKPRITSRDGVVQIMGNPEENRINEYVYLYVDIYAKRDKPYIQEAHIFFDENDIVKKTTYVNITKGDKWNDPSNILENLSLLEIGNSSFNQIKAMLYPSAYSDHYEDGSLQYKLLQYSTEETLYRPLEKLPYVIAKVGDGSVTYSLYFTEKGILKAPELD